jgi:hypothetical protein
MDVQVMKTGETRDQSDFDGSQIDIPANWEDIEKYLNGTNLTKKDYDEWLGDWDWYFVEMIERKTHTIWGLSGSDGIATLLYVNESVVI